MGTLAVFVVTTNNELWQINSFSDTREHQTAHITSAKAFLRRYTVPCVCYHPCITPGAKLLTTPDVSSTIATHCGICSLCWAVWFYQRHMLKGSLHAVFIICMAVQRFHPEHYSWTPELHGSAGSHIYLSTGSLEG